MTLVDRDDEEQTAGFGGPDDCTAAFGVSAVRRGRDPSGILQRLLGLPGGYPMPADMIEIGLVPFKQRSTLARTDRARLYQSGSGGRGHTSAPADEARADNGDLERHGVLP